MTDRAELAHCGHATIASKKPVKVLLENGKTYYYCTCGKSQSQPFCDGSHEADGKGFLPLQYTHEGEDVEKSICACKQNKPESGIFCDGSHKTLPEKVDW